MAVAAVLLVAGCTVGGEATRAAPVLGSAPDAARSSAVQSSGTSRPPTTSAPAPTTSAPASSAPTSSSAGPSTTVSWALPLPTRGAGKKNRYGNEVASIGRTYGVEQVSTHQAVVVFVVDSLTIDAPCAEQAKPKNGHFLTIRFRAQLGAVTGPDLSDDGVSFSPDSWTVFDPKETAEVGTSSSAASDCVGDHSFPFNSDLEPGKLYRATVVLDVSSVKGSVVLLDSLDGGWIYQFG